MPVETVQTKTFFEVLQTAQLLMKKTERENYVLLETDEKKKYQQ
jgi:hypothetical protein